jgi:type VI secretion system protein VasG
VHEIFFQVFDKGTMEDGEGRLIDFKNTLILLTSNVGTETIADLCADPELAPGPEEIAKALRAPLLKVFPPALLGRIVTIPYYPLSDEMLARIIRLQLDRVVRRFRENHDAELVYGQEVVDLVASRCTEVESGGRMIDAILTNSILPRLSEIVLGRLIEQKPIGRIDVSVLEKDFAFEVS